MKDVIFVTGNMHKAKYFSEMVGMNIPHKKIDVDEIQSLDVREVVARKAKQAYDQIQQPVIVEDTKLVFNAMGMLPGPLIKFFFEELEPEGLCRILDGYSDRTATIGAAIAYYDGEHLEIFESELPGEIAKKPVVDSGFGWNKVFIPKGAREALGSMNDEEFNKWYRKVKPYDQIRKFLEDN